MLEIFVTHDLFLCFFFFRVMCQMREPYQGGVTTAPGDTRDSRLRTLHREKSSGPCLNFVQRVDRARDPRGQPGYKPFKRDDIGVSK